MSHSALSSRNYRIFISGNSFMVVGLWIQRLAMGWQAWQLSESSLMVGLVAGAQFMPLLVLTPFFGVLVDRIKPRNGAVLMHSIMMGIAILLAALTLQGLITIELLLLLALLNGIANSAYSPIRLSLIPDLVPPEQFPSAVAISATVFNASRFIGPSIAGGIVAWYGIGQAYVVNALTFVPIILALSMIESLTGERAPAKHDRYLDQLLEGIRYVRDHPRIRSVILIAGVSTFFGRGIIELLPALAVMIFEGGSTQLAVLMAAAGAGAIGSGLIYTVMKTHRRLRSMVLCGAIGVSLSMLLLANVSRMTWGIPVAAMLGFFASMASIGSQSEVQMQVDNELRGRVMALWTLAIIGGPAVGSIVAGAMANDVGPHATLTAFAGISLLLTALAAMIRPREPGPG